MSNKNEQAATKQSNRDTDISEANAQQLLPGLLTHFHNNREELALALGVSSSLVDGWIDGSDQPNTATLLRMRQLAQEREIK